MERLIFTATLSICAFFRNVSSETKISAQTEYTLFTLSVQNITPMNITAFSVHKSQTSGWA